MNDFDRLLELQLRRKLDAIMATPVPVRRGRLVSGRLAKGVRDDADTRKKGYLPVKLWLDRLVFVEHS